MVNDSLSRSGGFRLGGVHPTTRFVGAIPLKRDCASTLADGALSHEHSDSYRSGGATLGLIALLVRNVHIMDSDSYRLTRHGYFMNCCRETTQMGVPPGNRRVLVPRRT
jgi:hypothetical protein